MPVIDFSAYANGGSLDERKRVARALHDTCIDTGFFYLANHGISQAEIELAHDWGRIFFELPREVKAACNYTPVGGKNPSANPDKEADQKETYSLPRPLLPGEVEDHPNRTIGRGKWVDPALMPGFREFHRSTYRQAHPRRAAALSRAGAEPRPAGGLSRRGASLPVRLADL